MQDRQLDAFGRMNHAPDRETEQPGHTPDALRCGDERRRAESELLAAEAHAAGARRLDVLVPVRSTPEVQADDHRVPRTERAHRGVAYGAGLAPDVLKIGNRDMAGETQGYPVDRTARVPRKRSRESHCLPSSRSWPALSGNKHSFEAGRSGTKGRQACPGADLWPVHGTGTSPMPAGSGACGRARTRRKPRTSNGIQTATEPAVTRKAAVDPCSLHDLLSGRSRVRVAVGAQVIYYSHQPDGRFVPVACPMA